jgi:hypothetical protein
MERSIKEINHSHREEVKLLEERIKAKEIELRQVAYEIEGIKYQKHEAEKERMIAQKKLDKAEGLLEVRSATAKQMREREL